MNYRHAFHAGNFADVFKHALLARILRHMTAKEAALRYIDTHAGIGLYNLSWDEAKRTGEADGGIRRYRSGSRTDRLAELFAPYDKALAAAAASGKDFYPGSPLVASALLRPQDRLSLAELHPEDVRTLRRRFGHDRRATIAETDGWQALKAWLPPPERRGLVLIDPPFEAPDELQRMTDALDKARRKWATGIYALWHPVKDWRDTERFCRAVAALAAPKTLRLEITVDADGEASRLTGSGMIVVNPPWRLIDEAREMLPWLARTLATGRRQSWKAEWLVGEGAT
jgi:23S rRNA (adenine2030-N6)-methyltransferase